MTYVLIDHEVASYDDWKPVFDDHDATRLEYGQQSYRLLQGSDDPNHVVILFEFESADRARELIESDDLRERMGKAGVKGKPTITFLDQVEQQDLDQVEQQDLAQPSA